jgi:hypothetical protein
MTRKESIQVMAAKTGAPKADMELTVGGLLEVRHAEERRFAIVSGFRQL